MLFFFLALGVVVVVVHYFCTENWSSPADGVGAAAAGRRRAGVDGDHRMPPRSSSGGVALLDPTRRPGIRLPADFRPWVGRDPHSSLGAGGHDPKRAKGKRRSRCHRPSLNLENLDTRCCTIRPSIAWRASTAWRRPTPTPTTSSAGRPSPRRPARVSGVAFWNRSVRKLGERKSPAANQKLMEFHQHLMQDLDGGGGGIRIEDVHFEANHSQIDENTKLKTKLKTGNEPGQETLGPLAPSSYKTHLKLSIRHLTIKDFGSYRCVAKNPRGETDGTIKIYRKSCGISLSNTPSARNNKKKEASIAALPLSVQEHQRASFHRATLSSYWPKTEIDGSDGPARFLRFFLWCLFAASIQGTNRRVALVFATQVAASRFA